MDETTKAITTDTIHQNYINCLRPYIAVGSKVEALATSDPNGYLHVWDVSSV